MSLTAPATANSEVGFVARDPLYAVTINNPTRLAGKPQTTFFTVGDILV